MNIFYLHKDPETAAQMHVDKHCVKMILETCQLLSTAHRVLDGELYYYKNRNGRKSKTWYLPDEREALLYSATHINHPSAVWARHSNSNYMWLHQLLLELCREYTYRYGKVHKCEAIGLVNELRFIPKNIPIGEFTEPTPAMPDKYKIKGDSVQSYRNYYNGEKQRMFSWKQRPVPEFINMTIGENYAAI